MKLHRSTKGNALMIALMFAVILTAIAGTGFRILQDRYHLFFQAASWQEALLSAEAGIDLAVGEMRKGLVDPTVAWQGWTTAQGGTPSGPITPTAGTVFYTSTVLLRSGEGGQRSWSEISVDAPAFLQDSTGEQWYRVRSLGVSEIPGGGMAVGSTADLALRRLDLFVNHRTGNKVTTPQATRLIEAVAKPVGTFRTALLGVDSINLNNQNIVVDSYDSRYTDKSTNGFYDVNKRQDNGNIATNGILIDAGNAHIYGTASTNGGTVLNATNVTGEIRNDFYQEILPVQRPDVLPDAGTPTQILTGQIIDAKPGDPAQFQFSRINLSGQETLRIRGAADGSETFAQIVVTGDVSLTGQAQIVLDPGVYVRIFVVGDSDMTGNGVQNPGKPVNFQFYGVDRPDNPDGTPAAMGAVKIGGNGGFRGSVYAPNYNVDIVGGGANDTVYGSFVGNQIVMTGVQSVHYDEALNDGGLISDYKVISWFEDIR